MASRIRRIPLKVAMLVSVCFLCKGTLTSGAGRAFPIASENYVIQNFRRINPRLEWDPTNFLVDLSGQYANCLLFRARLVFNVDKMTEEGKSIVGYVDYTDGANADANSVNGYLKRIIDRWMAERILLSQIRGSDRFGCSVRPGCDGRVAVGCLFSPGGDFVSRWSTWTPRTVTFVTGVTTPPERTIGSEVPRALAFTPEQYRTAEDISGKRWDRSHFLENLSGLETDCSMVTLANCNDWRFTKIEKLDKTSMGECGYERNEGSTPDALGLILRKMPKLLRRNTVVEVGCSVIPDCIYYGQMYVVVSCALKRD